MAPDFIDGLRSAFPIYQHGAADDADVTPPPQEAQVVRADPPGGGEPDPAQQAREARDLIRRLLGLDLPGPTLLHSGEDKPWIPQGQGVHGDEVLTTYTYDTENFSGSAQVLLSLQDQVSGAETHNVILGGGPVAGGAPGETAAAPSKGGGVSTDGEFVYVADTREVYVYRRSDIEAAAEGDSVPAVHVHQLPEDVTASYIAVRDGVAYIGRFGSDDPGSDYYGNPELYQFSVSDGVLQAPAAQGGSTATTILGEDSDPPPPITTPYKAQGVAVTHDGGLLFTAEIDGDKQLVYRSPDGEERGIHGIDTYAEGLNIVGDEVWVTYEDGAHKYDGDKGHSYIVRIPISDLDIDPASLIEP